MKEARAHAVSDLVSAQPETRELGGGDDPEPLARQPEQLLLDWAIEIV